MDNFDNDAPPPYSEHDPLQSQQHQPHSNADMTDEGYNNTVNAFSGLSISSGPFPSQSGAEETPPLSSSPINSQTERPPLIPPSTFASAARYFAERPPPTSSQLENNSHQQQEDETLVHSLTIYPRSQGKDFPHRPRCWNQRAQDIDQHDWDTFLRFLFPPHLGLAASSPHLPQLLRSEIRRDRKDRPQETDQERRARIAAVIAEWNISFFVPRGAEIWWVYVVNPESGPVSPLCPRCYPATTHATSQGRPPSMHDAFTLYQPVLQIGGVGGVDNDYFAQSMFNASASKKKHSIGSAGWAAYISTRAKQYADALSEHAQQYGRQIEENSRVHGRWVEGHVKMRGRQMEEMGKLFGNYCASVGDAIARETRVASRGADTGPAPRGAGTYPVRNPWSANAIVGRPGLPPQRQITRRRSSCSSQASADSLSSIDSLSTVSDLNPDDLAEARAKLLSLNDHHDRELQVEATRIRAQLRDLQQQRQHSRLQYYHTGGRFRGGPFLGRGEGRGRLVGRGGPHHHYPAGRHRHGGGLFRGRGSSYDERWGRGRGGWGRWDSPEDSRQRDDNRRALKEEKKLLRDAFRDVERRAKRETRARKNIEAREERVTTETVNL